MPAIDRVEPFAALADIYHVAGFERYVIDLAPRLLDLAYSLEWTGRSVYDMSCGPGDLIQWFCRKGFRALGVDTSAPMVDIAQGHGATKGLTAEFIRTDIRTHAPRSPYELVVCFNNALNTFATLRDLEQIFLRAAGTLAPGKLFIFDLTTIYGLARLDAKDQVLFENGTDLTIMTRESFNYEALMLTRQFTVWRYRESYGWQRQEETHTLRGYPLQGVTALLSRCGFTVARTLTEDLAPADGKRDVEQVIIVARRN